MSLPELIEIVPLDKPVRAEITVPGSKSITNRALILAALAEGEVTLEGALWSEDTQIMTECLQELGFMVDVRPDPSEFCNRTITVYGKGGTVPSGGTEQQPMELFVGNAGTAARFLAAFVCLGKGVYRLHGVPRMHERPQAALFKALRELGYRVEAEQGNDKLPVKIFGNEVGSARCADRTPQRGVSTKTCTVSIEESSQFASALLLCAKPGGWQVEVVGENAEESPYVAMTSKLIEAFPHRGGKFQIEPDASSGSYFWAAGMFEMIPTWKPRGARQDFGSREQLAVQLKDLVSLFPISVIGWPDSGWQTDAAFPVICLMTTLLSRKQHLADSIMTAMILAPFGSHLMKFTDLARLRLQECERVEAMKAELSKCGAKVVEEDDSLTISSSIDIGPLGLALAFCSETISHRIFKVDLHGAEIETYNDHRMAMCFAILGLKVPGIKIKNPACVKKTFPNFFQKVAGPPPNGLGATILDVKTGRKLTHEELFAD